MVAVNLSPVLETVPHVEGMVVRHSLEGNLVDAYVSSMYQRKWSDDAGNQFHFTD